MPTPKVLDWIGICWIVACLLSNALVGWLTCCWLWIYLLLHVLFAHRCRWISCGLFTCQLISATAFDVLIKPRQWKAFHVYNCYVADDKMLTTGLCDYQETVSWFVFLRFLYLKSKCSFVFFFFFSLRLLVLSVLGSEFRLRAKKVIFSLNGNFHWPVQTKIACNSVTIRALLHV